jgi:hypothetical protein
MHAAADELYQEFVGTCARGRLRVATSRFTTVSDGDVHRSMKDWPTCRLLESQASNVARQRLLWRRRFAGRMLKAIGFRRSPF